MALPQSVEEQEKLADELMKGTVPTEQEETESPQVVDPVHDPVEEPEVEAKPEDPKPKEKIDPTDYETRLKLFKKAHDEKISGLRQEVARMQKGMQAQETERSALLAQLQAKEERERHELPTDLLDENEQAIIGEDLMPILTKMARAIAAKETQPLVTQVERLNNDVSAQKRETQESAAANANKKFGERIVSAKADALVIDNDPEFHGWLSAIDELSGVQRKYLYSRAWETRDVGRIVSLYKDWQATTGEQQASDPREHRITPAPAGEIQRGNGGGKIWTDQAIKELYSAWQRGTISDKKADALEQDLFAAQRDGRYRA